MKSSSWRAWKRSATCVIRSSDSQSTASSGTSFFGGIALHGDLLLAGAEDGNLYAFNTKTGKQVWTYPTSGPVTAPAVCDDKLIYLPARDGYVHAVRPDGRRSIRYDVGNAVEQKPGYDNGFLYAVGGNRVEAFDTVDQRPWWERSFEEESPQFIVAGGGYVVVITDKP